jgi:hypothetical protein
MFSKSAWFSLRKYEVLSFMRVVFAQERHFISHMPYLAYNILGHSRHKENRNKWFHDLNLSPCLLSSNYNELFQKNFSLLQRHFFWNMPKKAWGRNWPIYDREGLKYFAFSGHVCYICGQWHQPASHWGKRVQSN